MNRLKVKRHYIRSLFRIPIYYLVFEGMENEKFMTLSNSEYRNIIKNGLII